MLATFTLLLSLAHAEDNPVGEGKGAKVQVEATKPGVTVTVVYDESTSTVATSYGTGNVYNFKKQDVCQAPCQFEIQPGMRAVLFSGTGYVPAGGRYDLREGTSTFNVKPGSKALAAGGYYALLLGLTAATTGAVFWALDDKWTDYSWAPATTIAGGAVAIAGVPMMVFSKTKVEFGMAK